MEDQKPYKPVPDVECLKYHGTPEKPDIKIFVSHRIDLDSETIDNPLYIPVRCGAVYDKRENVAMLGDDTGDNISEKRLSYCELTVQYWAWKNVKADYYGLCHYRRYLSFSADDVPVDNYGNVVEEFIGENEKLFYGLNYESALKKIHGYDIAVTSRDDVTEYGSVIAQFDSVDTMHVEWLHVALNVILKHYPEYFEDARDYFYGKVCYFDNMFIMKREIFNDYCNWLFTILKYVEQQIDTANYCNAEMRAVGMVGERLLGVYLTHWKKVHPYGKILELQRVLFLKPENIHFPVPYYKGNNIAIAFSSSDYFVPYVGVTIRSLLENASTEFNYDIIILNTDITDVMKEKLQLEVGAFNNAHIRFFNVTPFVKGKKFSPGDVSHVSVNSFYRLLIPDIFCEFEKIIFLDGDLVICDDISKIWKLNINGKLLAATHDPDFAGEYNGAVPGIAEYVNKVLMLKKPYDYFQAGVLIFNIKEMKSNFIKWSLCDYATTQKFKYLDQDVLNVKCENRVFFLEQRWNVEHDCSHIRYGKIIARAPVKLYNDYVDARKSPAIIHYAGCEKPWESVMCDFAECFWSYARRTIFYEALIFRMQDYHLCHYPPVTTNQSFARDVADRLLPKGSRRREALKKIMPKGSPLWNVCKKIYHIFD